MNLPTEKTEVKRKNPSTLLFYAKPKVGKTTILSQLEDNLIINLEKGGTDFISGLIIDLGNIESPIDKINELRKIAAEIKAKGRPYKYVSIDTFTEVDACSEWTGTERYMNSTQGKGFNKIEDPTKPQKDWKQAKYGDDEYESVHTLPQGYGYRWSRTEVIELYNILKDLGSVCTIFVCHVKDKLVGKNDKGEVFIKDISLTGAVSDIISRQVDAIGSVYNDDGKLMISFKGNEEKTGGSRAKHITGYEGEFDWSKIFIEE